MTLRSSGLPAALLLALTGAATAQERVLPGRVIDRLTRRPVPAGEVVVRGTEARDRLRPDGVFVLHVRPGPLTLLVKSPGYRPRTVEVPAADDVVFVELDPLVLTLDPVRLEVTSTGSDPGVAVVSGAEVQRTPVASIEQAMQGRVVGADIQQSEGVPAGGWHTRLRGVVTVLGNASPLWVVDGVVVSGAGTPSGAAAVTGGLDPMPSRIADLNPHDIASIEVLRGAAATARYGSRGTGGVVLITTVRGLHPGLPH